MTRGSIPASSVQLKISKTRVMLCGFVVSLKDQEPDGNLIRNQLHLRCKIGVFTCNDFGPSKKSQNRSQHVEGDREDGTSL